MEARVGLEVPSERRIEGREELAIGQDRTQQPRLLVVVVAVALSPALVELCLLGLAQAAGELAQIPVCDIVLQCMRDGVVELLAQRHIASAQVVIVVRAQQVSLAWGIGTLAHGLIG